MTESKKFVLLYFVHHNPKCIDFYAQQMTYWSKIPLIKYWRSFFGSGLKEAKDEVESLIFEGYFKQIDYHQFVVSDKGVSLLNDMISIDEIRVETIKWVLLSYGLKDTESVSDLYKKIHDIWKE